MATAQMFPPPLAHANADRSELMILKHDVTTRHL